MHRPPLPVRPARRSPGGDRCQTAAGVIHNVLREEIISLSRRPGEVISEKDIAAAHGVSRTPVREALLRLADEGLVDIAPQSGTHVARIPVGDLPEAVIARCVLEVEVVRAAAERAGATEVAVMRDLLARQQACAASGDRDGFHEADDALHRVIATTAGYMRLWRLVLQVRTQLDRFRRLTLPQPGRMERTTAEHILIVEAIARNDVAGAASAMTAHLGRVKDDLAVIHDVNPEYFTGDVAEILARWGAMPVLTH